MSAVFLKLLNLSITASWLILAVILVRVLFKKAPKWISCVLWGLVALRLICPFSWESALSLIPSRETVPSNIGMMQEPAIDSGITVINEAVNPALAQSLAPDPLGTVNPLQLIVSVLSVVWAAGAAAMLLYALISYIKLKKSVGASVRVKDNIFACDDVKSPFILGIIRPLIYVPSAMNEATLDYVLTHEKAHIARRDHWWKPFGFLLLTVYWFNPLCWLAYVLLCRDIEIACDEKVIRDMDRDSLAGYSQALLDCSFPRRKIAVCPLAFGEVGVKERVKNVLNYKKPAFWIILIAVLACAAVAVCFLTSPKGEYRIPWDQFCFYEGAGGASREIKLSAKDKQYIAELLNQGEWKEGSGPESSADDQYKFIFESQIVNYHSTRGVFLDTAKKKSLTVSDSERQKINGMLEQFNGNAEGRIHVPDKETVLIDIQKMVVSGDKPSITVKWHNLADKDFSLGLYYCLYHYENGQYVRMPQNDRIFFNDSGIVLEKDCRHETTYDLSAFDIIPEEKYRLYLNDLGQSDFWIDFTCGEENIDIPAADNMPPSMTVTDGITLIKAVTGRYTWFFNDSADGTKKCAKADSPSFDSEEMQEFLPVISVKPLPLDRRKSNEVYLQFIGTAPDRVSVFCAKENAQDIVWDPVEVMDDCTIELAEGKHLYKVDAYFGESYAEYGFYGNFAVLTVYVPGSTDIELQKQAGEETASELKEKYPEYFDLPTSKGLEVYVWQMAHGSYSFGLLPGTNREKLPAEFLQLKGASAEEMKAILSAYGLNEQNILIIPWQNPISSYVPDTLIKREGEDQSAAEARRQEYINDIRSMLFD